VKREATIAGLASEGLARISGSAAAGNSAVVGPTPTDPVEFRRCAQDLKTLSAAKKHTNEERGNSRDPGVRRPGAGSGQVPARSLIFLGGVSSFFVFFTKQYVFFWTSIFFCHRVLYDGRVQVGDELPRPRTLDKYWGYFLSMQGNASTMRFSDN